jgi:hypothetical protein
MRAIYVSQVAITAVITSALAYLINQLPPIPDFPHKFKLLVASVVVLTCLSALVLFWESQKEIRSAAEPEQRSTFSHSANSHQKTVRIPLSGDPFTARSGGVIDDQFSVLESRGRAKLDLPQKSHFQISWNSVFSLLIFILLHFCLSLVLGLAIAPSEKWLLIGSLVGSLVAAWIWTGFLALTWFRTGGSIGIIIVFLAGGIGLTVLLLVLLFVVWIPRVLSALISSPQKSLASTWSRDVSIVSCVALVLLQAWTWIAAVTVALALAGSATMVWKRLTQSLSESKTCVIMVTCSISGMAMGGLTGWGIRVANHF